MLPNVQASRGPRPAVETPIAANPVDPNDLLTGAIDTNCPSLLGFYASTDGGAIWNHHCMQEVSGGTGLGDPGVGYDLHGSLYAIGVQAFGIDDLPLYGPLYLSSAIVFEKSADNGATWSSPAVAVPPLFPEGIADKPWLEIDNNPASPHASTLYVSTTQFDTSAENTQISVSRSTDGGSTWTTAAVDDLQIYPMSDQFSDIAIGDDGTVYVSWQRCLATINLDKAGLACAGGPATLVVSRSTDGGNTWGRPTPIATVTLAPHTCGRGCNAWFGNLPNTRMRVSNIPVIGIDTSGGIFTNRLYAAFYNWTGTFMQAQVAYSADRGSTWSTPVPVAPESATRDQFFPWLSVSATGSVGVTWLDRRDDPANLSYEAFATWSTDGGSSFVNSQLISTAMSNPNDDGFGGFFIGDYIGNVWTGNTLRASWVDTRDGTAQNMTGGYVTPGATG